MAPSLQNNRMLLAQARMGIAVEIDQSPDVGVVQRIAFVPDGFGGMIADPTGAFTPVSVRLRVSHERRGVNEAQPVPAGLDTALSLWILWKHTDNIRQDEAITVRGRLFKVGAIDPLMKFEGVQAYQAPLYPAGDVPSGLVTGVSLNGADPEELLVDDTFQLVATIVPESAADQSVSWASDDESVATVDDEGHVTGVAAGTAHITVTTTNGGFTAVREFEVIE